MGLLAFFAAWKLDLARRPPSCCTTLNRWCISEFLANSFLNVARRSNVNEGFDYRKWTVTSLIV